MAALGRAGLIDVESKPAGALLKFRPEAGTRERLAAIVAAESQCCAFLELALLEEDDSLGLSIAGPTGSEPIVNGMVAAFRGELVSLA